MRGLSKFFGSLAFAAVYTSCSSGHETNVGGLILAAIFAVIAAVLAASADARGKAARTALVKKIVDEALAGGEPAFYFYLRPFSITNKVPMADPGLRTVENSLQPGRVQDYESILNKTLEASGITLVALGRPGESSGAGRYLTTDDQWQSIFYRLAEVARAIITVPAVSASTFHESEWLVQNGHIAKAIFVKPPKMSTSGWAEVVEKYSSIGVILPRDIGFEGAIFRVAPDGRVIGRLPVEILWRREAGQAIRDLRNLTAS